MKPYFESVCGTINNSFLVRKFEERYFSAPYHYHPEYELTLILEGNGKRYVGPHMQDYAAGDLVLLGANLPHCWKTGENPISDSVSIVVHFKQDFMGEDFFSRPEMKQILALLSNSNYGVQFTGNPLDFIPSFLQLLNESDSFKKWIKLLDILHALASKTAYIIIDKHHAYATLSSIDKERINKIMGYIVENFENKIVLSEAAAAINMTTHAFCKYFKKITRKTFVEAVNDYRIDYAINQLIHTDKPIAQIGFDCGFNDMSNFYKIFRQRIKISPLQYRNNFTKKLM